MRHSRSRLNTWVGPALLAVASFAAEATGAESKPSPAAARLPDRADAASEAFFGSGAIPHLRVEITGTNLAALKKDHRQYVRATVREGDRTYPDVALRLKGSEEGSFQPLDAKPSLTLNFDKFKEGQDFHGLDKIYLNNSVEDESYLGELLGSELFRAAGVPAPRVTHALLTLNGKERGLYVLKEGFDRRFLSRAFTNATGNLYEGDLLTDVTEPLHLNSGEGPKNHADLKALGAAAQESDLSNRWARLQGVLDMDRFLSFLAMEIITWHWDGYGMNKNNYRVYGDPMTKRLVFMPSGMDRMFSRADGPIVPPMEGLVARAVLQTPEGRRRYRQRVAALCEEVLKVGPLTNRIQQVQTRLRPVLAKLGSEAAEDHDVVVEDLIEQLNERATALGELLKVPEPKPPSFDDAGAASLVGWRPDLDPGKAILEPQTDETSRRTLHIRAGAFGKRTAAWRTEALLSPGRYRFEGRVRTAGVVPPPRRRTEGASLGLGNARQSFVNRLAGTVSWTSVALEFEVTSASEEVEFLCQLTAAGGEAWFDLDSLKLRKLGK